jgi:hypothetical protein
MNLQYENPKEIDHFEDVEVDDRIILKWILKNWCGVCGLDKNTNQ